MRHLISAITMIIISLLTTIYGSSAALPENRDSLMPVQQEQILLGSKE